MHCCDRQGSQRRDKRSPGAPVQLLQALLEGGGAGQGGQPRRCLHQCNDRVAAGRCGGGVAAAPAGGAGQLGRAQTYRGALRRLRAVGHGELQPLGAWRSLWGSERWGFHAGPARSAENRTAVAQSRVQQHKQLRADGRTGARPMKKERISHAGSAVHARPGGHCLPSVCQSLLTADQLIGRGRLHQLAVAATAASSLSISAPHKTIGSSTNPP